MWVSAVCCLPCVCVVELVFFCGLERCLRFILALYCASAVGFFGIYVSVPVLFAFILVVL